MWGKQVYNTGDLSRNNWYKFHFICFPLVLPHIYKYSLINLEVNYMWLAMVTLGEGWHNNHHAFDYSARHDVKPQPPTESQKLVS
ncbi:hypothetical protein DVH24_013154 [Malus domestica]|uniref:Fatty acid desaturase domain-containing protein n=1 Tax=Malus domestica TaxID=3750 RepID=A0A498IL17_MALDO|nr:hypothetical protein DVH24_013154 [Malus domestica]